MTRDSSGSRSELQGWAPLRVFRRAGQSPQDAPVAELCDLSGIRPTEPFFESTLQRAMREPYRVLFRREIALDSLEAQLPAMDLVAPAGFILHMSRCGSTLVSQMLAASARNVVISEGWAIDSLLHCLSAAAGRATPEEAPRSIRTVIRALGQQFGGPADAAGSRYFVKFDAWHTLALPLLRRAFPETPWVFVYRDPVEVMASQLKRAAHWTAPGAVPACWTGMSGEAAAAMEPGEYVARLLRAICDAALGQMPEGGMALNYSRLPAAVFDRLARHFHCEFDPAEAAAMNSAAFFDAKEPGYIFEPDAAEKQRDAKPFVRRLSQLWLEASYERLEANSVR